MNGFGLFAAFVDGQHQTAVEQFFVHIDGRGGEHQHHRALNAVLLGHQVAGGFVLAGAGNGQFAVRLQQFQDIGRLANARFLGDGQNLVLQIRFAKIEKAPAGHGAVLDLHIDPHLLRAEVLFPARYPPSTFGHGQQKIALGVFAKSFRFGNRTTKRQSFRTVSNMTEADKSVIKALLDGMILRYQASKIMGAVNSSRPPSA